MELFDNLKKQLTGRWKGEGFAKFPTIDDTAYTEETEFKPDEYKDAIFFVQKSWYKNNTEKNGQTVFWDTGFIFLKADEILFHSVQVGGRQEQYKLSGHTDNRFIFDSLAIAADPKTIRSQRVFTIGTDTIEYELNMATHQAVEFQNHLKALIRRAG